MSTLFGLSAAAGATVAAADRKATFFDARQE